MNEENFIPLSALQHWAYCPRQCSLIHLDQAFDENLHTLRGRAAHKRVDQPGIETAKGVRVEYALPLWHDDFGMFGKADAVEFDKAGHPYPVEHKHGSRHKATGIAACDDIQLAAQAMCLEWMTGFAVPEGAIYYASSRRRRVVTLDTDLRARVETTVSEVRHMVRMQHLPPPLAGDMAAQRCKGCSLRDRCQPQVNAAALRRAAQGLFDPDFDPTAEG